MDPTDSNSKMSYVPVQFLYTVRQPSNLGDACYRPIIQESVLQEKNEENCELPATVPNNEIKEGSNMLNQTFVFLALEKDPM